MRVHPGLPLCLKLSLSFDCKKSKSGMELLDSVPGKYVKHQMTSFHADLLKLYTHNILIDKTYSWEWTFDEI
jgi:hypothetical protein